MAYEETALWTATLGSRGPDDLHKSARTKLREAFKEFHTNVKPLGQEVALSVPGYTDHSIEHSDSLWDTATLIVGEDFAITPAEAFVLGGSFLIHDLAMGLAAYSEGLPQIISSEPWRDLLWAEWSDRAPHLQQQLEIDVENNPTWDGITSAAVKSTLTTFLREHHAEEAEDLLKKNWQLSSGEPFFLLSNPELRHWYSEVIGKVARSHWLDVHELEKYLPASFGAPASFPPDWTVDPLKVACILRLADASQIDSRRAHPLHTPFRQPQGISKTHWEFQEMMLLPFESEGRIVFSSSRSFDPSRADAWWLAYDTVAMVNSELQAVDSLCADRGRPRMLCRSAAGAEAPERFEKYVPTTGWRPVDARPRIRNPIRVIESLGGRALYGDEDDVPLRELLANATDASLARVAAQGGQASVPPTQVNFFEVDDSHFVRIRDYGIGMSPDDIEHHLCDFGSSGWRSQRFRSEYPGAISSGYSSTGKFGIGFFSVFMIADDVRVVSRSLQASWDDTFCLEFKHGISHRPVLHRAEKVERLHEPGTEVTLRLRHHPARRGGLLHAETPYSDEDQIRFIQSLAFTCRHPISVSPLGSSDWREAIDDQPWHQSSPKEIYEATHWDPFDRTSAEAHATALEYFEKSLAPLRDSESQIIGMLCTTAVRFGSHSLSSAAGYCGGFKSGDIPGLSGLVEGSTIRASRDRVSISTTLERMQDWISEQWRLNSPPVRNVSETELLRLHSLSVGFGIERPNAPISMTRDGILTLGETESWIADREKFHILDSGIITGFVNLPGAGNWVPSGEDLFQLEGDTLLTMYGMRDFDDGLPDPIFEDPFESDWVNDDLAVELEEKASWWWVEHNTPVGSVVRAACRAWKMELRDVLMSVSQETGEVGGDGRDPIRTYSGRRALHTWITVTQREV